MVIWNYRKLIEFYIYVYEQTPYWPCNTCNLLDGDTVWSQDRSKWTTNLSLGCKIVFISFGSKQKKLQDAVFMVCRFKPSTVLVKRGVKLYCRVWFFFVQSENSAMKTPWNSQSHFDDTDEILHAFRSAQNCFSGA